MWYLEDQIASYAACHQDARNKAMHFVGVPLITLAILVPLSGVQMEIYRPSANTPSSFQAAEPFFSRRQRPKP